MSYVYSAKDTRGPSTWIHELFIIILILDGMLHESLMLMILAQDAAPISTQEMVAIWDKGHSEHQVQESLDRMLQRCHIVFFGLAAQYLRYWDIVSTSLQYLQCMIEIDTIRYTTHNYDIYIYYDAMSTYHQGNTSKVLQLKDIWI